MSPRMRKCLRVLALLAALFAFGLVMFGAFVRLSNAGLSCPDWPTCYGQVTWPQHAQAVAHADASFPDRPYEAHKAWREQVHRFLAGTLGVMVLVLAQLHRHGVVHNDLAKEPNWLVDEHGDPALVDFQIAWTRGRRGRLYRLLAREDLRHLLKHKRTYCPQALSARQRAILDAPAIHSRLWRATGKRLYKLVARRLFGYWDNEGKGRVRE